eukprot:3491355-Amphidinium_carterae.1
MVCPWCGVAASNFCKLVIRVIKRHLRVGQQWPNKRSGPLGLAAESMGSADQFNPAPNASP